jgi:transcriptional regulator with XRE-family HTH domain
LFGEAPGGADAEASERNASTAARILLMMNDASAQVTSLPATSPLVPETASPETLRQVLGERMRMARSVAHLTQEELAGQTYSKSYISAVERGKMLPSLSALRLLAERLGVPIAYFLGEGDLVSHSLPPEAQAEEAAGAVLLQHAEELLERGCYEEAAAALRQCLEGAEPLSDARTRGHALATLVAVYTAQKEYAHALAMARPALDMLRASQDYGIAGQVHLHLATIHAATRDEAAAEHAFQEAIGAWEEAGEQLWLSYTHEQYGYFLAARKRYREAYEQMRLAQAQDG